MNTKRLFSICLCVLLCKLMLSCHTNKKNKDITIFAAASLKDVVNKTAKIYTKKTGFHLSLNFASSGILARQIEQGANADFFFSANQDWINYTIDKKILQASSKLKLAENRMVIVVPNQSALNQLNQVSLEHLSSLFEGRIAIGDPCHVPAGKYAQKILMHNKQWHSLKTRLLPCKNARETLLIVEMGEVEMGIVYLSNAKKSKKVRCIYEFPSTKSSPICYYSAHRLNPNSKIKNFQNFLKQTETKNIWKDYAFIIND